MKRLFSVLVLVLALTLALAPASWAQDSGEATLDEPSAVESTFTWLGEWTAELIDFLLSPLSSTSTSPPLTDPGDGGTTSNSTGGPEDPDDPNYGGIVQPGG